MFVCALSHTPRLRGLEGTVRTLRTISTDSKSPRPPDESHEKKIRACAMHNGVNIRAILVARCAIGVGLILDGRLFINNSVLRYNSTARVFTSPATQER